MYSFSQLEQLWIQAGGTPLAAPMAAAVAMAESGGRPDALNQNTNGTTDRGLWQINSIHGSLSVLDPLANAKAAVQISNNGTTWRPWCTAWSNGRCGGSYLGTGAPYQKYLDSGSYTGTAVSGTTGSTDTAGLSIPNPFGSGSPLNPSTWANAFLGPIFRSGMYLITGLLGAALMTIGILILLRNSPPVAIVRNAVGSGFTSATKGFL